MAQFGTEHGLGQLSFIGSN